MQPVPIFDRLIIERAGGSAQLTCDHPELPVDSRNLVFRAAESFFRAAGINEGARIRLEKRLPLAAGLGGGSANAAVTLRGLNDIFGRALSPEKLDELARALGSDVPFFLQDKPALGIGRGEQVTPLEHFPALRGTALFLIHPGFGVSTPWAYKNLARFPKDLNGEPGRAHRLIAGLGESIEAAKADFYNSLEAPVLEKYPLLVMFQEFLREHGAAVALMSGSGSSTFALCRTRGQGEELAEKFKGKFGTSSWMALVTLP
jgi:4-diphosphocytidyl-2-C-methyl-D-erythritol kinase